MFNYIKILIYKYLNKKVYKEKIPFLLWYKCVPMKHQWCNGNMKPFQGFASGSIPD